MNDTRDEADEVPADLVGIKEATQMIKSPVAGKMTCLSTVYRLIKVGRIRCWKRGRYRFVSQADILALMEPQPLPVGAKVKESREQRRRMNAEIRRGMELAGIRNARAEAEAERILDEAGI